ncbi:MAG: AAA family ATPase [Phycisphaera sp.]|nr:AAA family ATPase [Phycisphaera sp.]
MNIVLIGYRGSGKTTIGKLLAHELWKKFIDVDTEVRARFGNATIADIWATQGEPAFRVVEVQVTKELLTRKDHVIALGGGTVMQPEAREAIKSTPDTRRIYLACEPEELARRIAQDTQTANARPDLTKLGGGVEEIKAVLAQRDPVYREVADVVFDVTHIEPKAGLRHLISRCL